MRSDTEVSFSTGFTEKLLFVFCFFVSAFRACQTFYPLFVCPFDGGG